MIEELEKKESKSWGIFETFSDYVIRQILFNMFPDKIRLYYKVLQ